MKYFLPCYESEDFKTECNDKRLKLKADTRLEHNDGLLYITEAHNLHNLLTETTKMASAAYLPVTDALEAAQVSIAVRRPTFSRKRKWRLIL